MSLADNSQLRNANTLQKQNREQAVHKLSQQVPFPDFLAQVQKKYCGFFIFAGPSVLVLVTCYGLPQFLEAANFHFSMFISRTEGFVGYRLLPRDGISKLNSTLFNYC